MNLDKHHSKVEHHLPDTYLPVLFLDITELEKWEEPIF
jgi:hypothetical protein